MKNQDPRRTADLTAMQADREVISQIAPLGWEPTFMALALGTKDDMEDGTNVDTKDGTTSEWFDLPCTACTLNPVQQNWQAKEVKQERPPNMVAWQS